jgi:hypothetical protein
MMILWRCCVAIAACLGFWKVTPSGENGAAATSPGEPGGSAIDPRPQDKRGKRPSSWQAHVVIAAEEVNPSARFSAFAVGRHGAARLGASTPSFIPASCIHSSGSGPPPIAAAEAGEIGARCQCCQAEQTMYETCISASVSIVVQEERVLA